MLRSLLLLSGLAALTSATASGPQSTDGKRSDDEIMNPDPNDNKYSEEANAVDAGTAQVKVCDEQDIFAEGNSFDLSAADVMDCTILNLWNVNTGDNGTEAVVNAIIDAGEENTIWKIDLGFNKIGDEGVKAIANLLTSGFSKVEWLNLHGNDAIGLEGMKALSKAIAQDNVLGSIDLGNNAMDIDSIMAFSEAIEVNTMIEEIWLNTNNIGAAGMSPFLRALGKNQGVKKVMLGGNSIGDVTNRVPFEMLLTQNNHLEIIDVGNNEIGDATAKHIAAGLAKNTALRSLDLDTNLLTESGARMIVGALEKNTVLEELWFTSNKIKDDTERKMLQGVAKEKNPTIRKVNARRLSRGGE